MLSESVAIADSLTSSPVYAMSSIVESACASQVITDLRACWDRVVLRRRNAKDTFERWHHGGARGSETASMPGVRISDVVEELRLLFVLLGQAKFVLPPASTREKSLGTPLKLPQKFEISSPPASP